MPRHTFIYPTDKPMVLHKDTLKEKYHLYPIYITINRRINRLDIKIKEDDNKNKKFKDEYIVISIDSTGIKITNRGQWMREKWHIKNKKVFENTCSR